MKIGGQLRGGNSHARTRRIRPRRHRGDHPRRGSPEAPDRKAQPQLQGPPLPALRRPRRPTRHRHAHLTRPRRRACRPSHRSGRHVLQASLPRLRLLLPRRPVRPGLAQMPLHPARPVPGRPTRRRGRLALPDGGVAPVARPQGVRPLGHHPELGRGRRGKKRWTPSRPPTSTRRWPTSPAT